MRLIHTCDTSEKPNRENDYTKKGILNLVRFEIPNREILSKTGRSLSDREISHVWSHHSLGLSLIRLYSIFPWRP